MKILDIPRSGSVAAQTSSHNRAGQYVRSRRSPVQPIGTGRRSFIRSSFGAASQAWSGLTDAQRLAWDSYAAGHPTVDSLGQSITLTGHQMWVGNYVSLLNVGQAFLTDVPASTVVPDVSAVSMQFSVAGGITFDGFSGATADFVTFGLSRQFSPGVSFNKTFWQPLSVQGYAAADASPVTIASFYYSSQFGTPVPNQKVFGKVTPVNQFGVKGAPAIVSCIVAP